MLPGDIALVAPKRSLIATDITWFTRSRYCHVRLITSADGTTLEAQPQGAVEGSVADGDVVVTVPLTDAQRTEIIDVAKGLEKTPYAFIDVAVLGLAQIGVDLPSLRRRLARPDRLFCSQLVDFAWGEVGFEAFTDKRLPQNVSPGDLADLAFTSGWPSATHKEN